MAQANINTSTSADADALMTNSQNDWNQPLLSSISRRAPPRRAFLFGRNRQQQQQAQIPHGHDDDDNDVDGVDEHINDDDGQHQQQQQVQLQREEAKKLKSSRLVIRMLGKTYGTKKRFWREVLPLSVLLGCLLGAVTSLYIWSQYQAFTFLFGRSTTTITTTMDSATSSTSSYDGNDLDNDQMHQPSISYWYPIVSTVGVVLAFLVFFLPKAPQPESMRTILHDVADLKGNCIESMYVVLSTWIVIACGLPFGHELALASIGCSIGSMLSVTLRVNETTRANLIQAGLAGSLSILFPSSSALAILLLIELGMNIRMQNFHLTTLIESQAIDEAAAAAEEQELTTSADDVHHYNGYTNVPTRQQERQPQPQQQQPVSSFAKDHDYLEQTLPMGITSIVSSMIVHRILPNTRTALPILQWMYGMIDTLHKQQAQEEATAEIYVVDYNTTTAFGREGVDLQREDKFQYWDWIIAIGIGIISSILITVLAVIYSIFRLLQRRMCQSYEQGQIFSSSLSSWIGGLYILRLIMVIVPAVLWGLLVYWNPSLIVEMNPLSLSSSSSSSTIATTSVPSYMDLTNGNDRHGIEWDYLFVATIRGAWLAFAMGNGLVFGGGFVLPIFVIGTYLGLFLTSVLSSFSFLSSSSSSATGLMFVIPCCIASCIGSFFPAPLTIIISLSTMFSLRTNDEITSLIVATMTSHLLTGGFGSLRRLSKYVWKIPPERNSNSISTNTATRDGGENNNNTNAVVIDDDDDESDDEAWIQNVLSDYEILQGVRLAIFGNIDS